MTTETFTPTPKYTIDGIGPYRVEHPYSAATDILAVVDVDGELIDVPAANISLVPEQSESIGDVWLDPTYAAANDGLDIYVLRKTFLEQGWVGVGGSREKGLEAQMDRLTRHVQDVSRDVGASLRIVGGTVKAYVPTDQTVPIWDEAYGGFKNGPLATDIPLAQGYAETAGVKATAAASSADAAAVSAVNYQPANFQTGLSHFRSTIAGAPDADLDVTGYVTIEEVVGLGKVARIGTLDVLNYKYLVPDECLMVAKGDVCALTIRLRTVGTVVLGASPAHVSMWLRKLDEAYDYVSTPISKGPTLTSDWQDFTIIYTADFDGHLRGGFYVRNDVTGTGFIECQILDQHVMKKENVTPYLSLSQEINPMDTAFNGGLVHDGGSYTANALAINEALIATVNETDKPLVFPAGLFRLNAANITQAIGIRDVKIYGQGDATQLRIYDNKPLFTMDARTSTLYNVDIRGFSAHFLAATYNDTRVVKCLADPASWTGAYECDFRNITAYGCEEIFEFQATKNVLHESYEGTPAHGLNTFTDIHTSIYSSRYPKYGIHFHGGPGPHSKIFANKIRARAGGYALKMGDGTHLFGDTTIVNNLFLGGDGAWHLTGPTDDTMYGAKMKLADNDVDGAAVSIGHMTNFDHPTLSNTALNGTPDDYEMDGCIGPNVAGLEGASWTAGAVGKRGVANGGSGTFRLWTIKPLDVAIGKSGGIVTVTAEIEAAGLGYRNVYAVISLTRNGTTWAVQFLNGPSGTSTGSFTITAVPNGDSVNINVEVTGAAISTGNNVSGQITVKGRNAKLVH